MKTRDHRGERIEYIEVTREGIRLANRLAHEVLGRTLDELPPQTRLVLTRLDAWVQEQCAQLELSRADFRFQRLDVRRITGMSEPRARNHLERLVALEYVLVHRGTRGQSFVYELVYDGQGQNGEPFLMGLIDPDTLDTPGAGGTYDGKFVGSDAGFVGSDGEFVAPTPTSAQRRPIVACRCPLRARSGSRSRRAERGNLEKRCSPGPEFIQDPARPS